MVRGHHARVGRMELAAPAFRVERALDLVDAFGHDESRPLRVLGQEVAKRTVEAPGQTHTFALTRDEGERARHSEDGRGVAGEQEAAALRRADVPQALARGIDEIDDAGDRTVHGQLLFEVGGDSTAAQLQVPSKRHSTSPRCTQRVCCDLRSMPPATSTLHSIHQRTQAQNWGAPSKPSRSRMARPARVSTTVSLPVS